MAENASESEDVPAQTASSTAEEQPPKTKFATGRSASACMRCKNRKTRCTYEWPSCSGCRKAKAECEYPNKDRPLWEYFRVLENRLKSIEDCLKPGTSKRQHPDLSMTESTSEIGPSTHKRIRTSSELSARMEQTMQDFRVGPPSSSQALDRLPSAVELIGLKLDSTEHNGDRGELTSSQLHTANYPPMERLVVAVDYYFAWINPAYPILHEPSFRAQLDAMFGDAPSASPQTIHASYVLLAIHAIDQARNTFDTANCRQKAREYWAISLTLLEAAWKGSRMGRLQSILLRLEYVLRDPDRGDVWELTGRAVRVAIELGLHLDPESSMLHRLDALEVDLRRRLFWVTYVADCKVSVALGRPCGISENWISTAFPSLYTDSHIEANGTSEGPVDHRKETGVHHARLRIIQKQIHERLNTVAAARASCPSQDWFQEMKDRLTEWKHGYTPVSGEYMGQQWLDLHYNMMLSLLYRPSPGNPQPNQESLSCAIKAASSIIRIYKAMWRGRTLNYIWLSIHHVFMAGVTYLNSIWIANRESWYIVPSNVEALLDIQTCSQILEAMSAYEPGTDSMRDAFETVSASVIRHVSSQAKPSAATATESLPFDFDSFLASAGQSTFVPDPLPQTSGSDGLLAAHRSFWNEDSTSSETYALMAPPKVPSRQTTATPPARAEERRTLAVPTAISTLEKFFSNPFSDVSFLGQWAYGQPSEGEKLHE